MTNLNPKAYGIKYAITLLMSLFFSQSYAALHLELTQGMNSAMPIAVVPFAEENSSSINLTTVISQDLQNSGRFNVMPVAKMQQQPQQLSQIDFDYWQKQNMDNIVIGSVTPVGSNYKVSFSLLSTYKGNAQNPNSSVIVQQDYTVNKNQLRVLAHRISDLIYHQLTGEKGIFSTRISYVLVKYYSNKPPQYFLEVADYDGYNPRALVVSGQPIMSPSWSPDGRKIAYVSLANNKASIYVVDVASGSQRLITDFPGINGAPGWSPNGSQLAIVLSKSGTPNIYLYNLGSSQLTQMTNDNSINTEPRFSPDGNAIIFTSNRGGGPQIYQMNLQSRQIKRLTFDGNYNATASFTADGRELVLLHQSSGDYNVAVQDLNSGALSVLTRDGYDSSPSVAPNAQMIIYASNPNNISQLAMTSIDGKIKIQLPTPDGSVKEPVWSPFLR